MPSLFGRIWRKHKTVPTKETIVLTPEQKKVEYQKQQKIGRRQPHSAFMSK